MGAGKHSLASSNQSTNNPSKSNDLRIYLLGLHQPRIKIFKFLRQYLNRFVAVDTFALFAFSILELHHVFQKPTTCRKNRPSEHAPSVIRRTKSYSSVVSFSAVAQSRYLLCALHRCSVRNLFIHKTAFPRVMFASHRPRVFRSRLGCCICGAKSSSSRFTSSSKYELLFSGCFQLNEKRQGEICNACVLLVKRWKKLPPGSSKNWKHVSKELRMDVMFSSRFQSFAFCERCCHLLRCEFWLNIFLPITGRRQQSNCEKNYEAKKEFKNFERRKRKRADFFDERKSNKWSQRRTRKSRFVWPYFLPYLGDTFHF